MVRVDGTLDEVPPDLLYFEEEMIFAMRLA
jgi:hypothetical protein